MKRTFTLLIAILFSVSLFAFTPASLFTVSSTSKYPLKLVIDNQHCNEKTSNEILVRDINAGYHQVKIYQERGRWNTGNRGHANQQLIYSGNICIKPGFHVDIVINRFGKVYIDEKKIGSGWHNDDNDNSYDWNSNNHFREPMNSNEFGQFKQTVANSSFDNTKLVIAKQTMSKNYFTAAQVKELVGLFSFESSKLDIAKAAYRNSIDKHNYFIVNDALDFSSSKEELTRFLETSK